VPARQIGMIPYIEIPPLVIANHVAIQPFGLLVVTGCAAGFLVGQPRLPRQLEQSLKKGPSRNFGWASSF